MNPPFKNKTTLPNILPNHPGDLALPPAQELTTPAPRGATPIDEPRDLPATEKWHPVFAESTALSAFAPTQDSQQLPHLDAANAVVDISNDVCTSVTSDIDRHTSSPTHQEKGNEEEDELDEMIIDALLTDPPNFDTPFSPLCGTAKLNTPEAAFAGKPAHFLTSERQKLPADTPPPSVSLQQDPDVFEENPVQPPLRCQTASPSNVPIRQKSAILPYDPHIVLDGLPPDGEAIFIGWVRVFCDFVLIKISSFLGAHHEPTAAEKSQQCGFAKPQLPRPSTPINDIFNTAPSSPTIEGGGLRSVEIGGDQVQSPADCMNACVADFPSPATSLDSQLHQPVNQYMEVSLEQGISIFPTTSLHSSQLPVNS